MNILAEHGFGLVENAWSLFSLQFLTFLAVTILFYYVLPRKLQWTVLLAASIIFYMFAGTPYTIVYLLASSLITWKAACWIAERRKMERSPKVIKRVYVIAMLSNVLFLAALKYSNFILRNVGATVSLLSGGMVQWSVSWIAALGISYYTLQIIAYLTDCYWEIAEPQRNYAKFFLFCCFFPQMISGPISRYDQLGTQLCEEHCFKKDNLMCGLIRISLGFFKKLVIAENFSRLADYFLDAKNSAYSYGIYAIIGIGCYVIELYGDFAGCMDIVLGAAKCLGIDMIENFNRPFASVSIQEFWQRWHITLGTWLKDYIMFPLLRSKTFQKTGKCLKERIGKQASQRITTYLAMLILWFCMGLWHGGGWNYIAEGVWFWLVIVLGQTTERFFNRVFHAKDHTGRIITWFRQARTTVIYAVGAVFFRGPQLVDVIKTMYRALLPGYLFGGFAELRNFLQLVDTLELSDGMMKYYLANGFFGFCLFVALSLWEKKYGKLQNVLIKHTCILQITSILIVLFVITILGVYGSGLKPSDFIYGGF